MNPQIVSLVEQTILSRLQAGASFTALDISNALKADCFPVTHREVAAVVRDIFESSAMDFYDYQRALIDVTTDGGAKKTQAWLYHPDVIRPRAYATRDLNALPPVPSSLARALPVSAPAVLPASPRQSSRSRIRRDGALSIPKRLIARLGWSIGTFLNLEAGANGLKLTVGVGAGSVRVWDDQRVRVCKRKLTAGNVDAEQAAIEIDGDGLRILTKA